MIYCNYCKFQAQMLCCSGQYFCKRHIFGHLSDKSKTHILKKLDLEEPSSYKMKELLESFKNFRNSIEKNSKLIIQKVENLTSKLIISLDKKISILEKSMFLRVNYLEKEKKFRELKLFNSFSIESDLEQLILRIEKHFKIFKPSKTDLTKKRIINKKNVRKNGNNNLETSEISEIHLEKKSDFDADYKLDQVDDDKARLQLDFDSKHSFYIFSIALSPLKDLLAVSETSKILRLFNVKNKTQVNVTKSVGLLYKLEFSFDSKFLACSGLLYSYILDLSTLQKLFLPIERVYRSDIIFHPSAHQVIYSPNQGKIIISNYLNGLQPIRTVNEITNRRTLFFYSVKNDGLYYNYLKKLAFHNFNSSNEITWNCPYEIKTYKISKNNEIIIVLTHSELFIVNPLDFSIMVKAPFKGSFLMKIDISVSRNYFIVNHKIDNTCIYDLKTGCKIFETELNASKCYEFSDYDNCIYFASIDKISIYSLSNSKICDFFTFESSFDRLKKEYIGQNFIVFPKLDNFSIINKMKQSSIKLDLKSKKITAFCMVESESLIILASEKTVEFWNYSSSQLIKEFFHHSEYIHHALYSQFTHTAATCCSKTLVIYSISQLSVVKVIKTENRLRKIRFSHFGNFLIGQDLVKIVKVWNTADGKSDAFYYIKEGFISYSAISQDLSYFVMISNLCCAKVWDRRTKSKVYEFNTLSSAHSWLEMNPEFQKPFKKYLIT